MRRLVLELRSGRDVLGNIARQALPELLLEHPIRADRHQIPGETITRTWCEHRHSPMTKDVATGTVGGRSRLTCGGNWDHCQVPEDKRDDM